MSRIIQVTLLILIFAGSFAVHAQAPVSVKGKIVEQNSGATISYASVAVMSVADNKIITGATTGEDGTFSFKTKSSEGIYFEVSFIGYKPKKIHQFTVNNGIIDLGNISLGEDSQTLQEVEITAEKSSVEFKLDKKVFNVGSDLSTVGVGALDVLNNVPSVNVDIEGQISLRGNSGVQILINGKPSVLADEQSNALGTLTGDMIESIEVITNPSAKYEAEGSSGIINIILKKEEKKGSNGSVSINTGIPNNHSLGFSLNKRTENFNLFTQLGAGLRTRNRESKSINQSYSGGSVIEGYGDEEKTEKFVNATLGADYYINDLNVITLSGNVAYEKESEPSDYDFYTYQEGQLVNYYQRNGETSANNPKFQYDLQYKKEFKNNKDHSLLFSATGNFFGKDQSSEFTNTLIEGDNVADNQKTTTDFHQDDYIFRLDYTNPLTKQVMLETGAMYEINDVANDYAVYQDESGEWTLDPNLSNNFEYNQKVLGVYATGAYEGKKWGVKGGLRLENTDLSTVLTTTNESNQRNYTNLFPSLHTSYKFSKMFSLQAGYSRRIRRPRLWDLNPFFNIQNTYSIRRGNPELMPEFADSYELTSIMMFSKVSLNASVYYLYTDDVIESVSYYQDNVNINQPENIGTRKQTGFEMNGKYDPANWISFNGDFNYGYFNREGVFNDQNFDFQGSQWTSKLSTKIVLPADFEVELSGNFESKYKTVQGERSGFAYADAGMRKKLKGGKAVINLSVRDIFASRIRESIVSQDDYYLYNFGKMGTFFTLGFSYSFGKGEAMTYSGGGRRH